MPRTEDLGNQPHEYSGPPVACLTYTRSPRARTTSPARSTSATTTRQRLPGGSAAPSSISSGGTGPASGSAGLTGATLPRDSPDVQDPSRPAARTVRRMLTVTALYSTPDDAEAFEAHYLSTHAPLVAAIPGLVRQETARWTGTPDGSPAPYYRVAHLYFVDAAGMQAGLGSPEGRATAQDATELAARTGCTLTLVLGELD